MAKRGVDASCDAARQGLLVVAVFRPTCMGSACPPPPLVSCWSPCVRTSVFSALTTHSVGRVCLLPACRASRSSPALGVPAAGRGGRFRVGCSFVSWFCTSHTLTLTRFLVCAPPQILTAWPPHRERCGGDASPREHFLSSPRAAFVAFFFLRRCFVVDDGWFAGSPHGSPALVEDEDGGLVVFDSDDEDECEDIFAGTWDAAVVAKRRRSKIAALKKRQDAIP